MIGGEKPEAWHCVLFLELFEILFLMGSYDSLVNLFWPDIFDGGEFLFYFARGWWLTKFRLMFLKDLFDHRD